MLNICLLPDDIGFLPCFVTLLRDICCLLLSIFNFFTVVQRRAGSLKQ